MQAPALLFGNPSLNELRINSSTDKTFPTIMRPAYGYSCSQQEVDVLVTVLVSASGGCQSTA